MNGFHPGSTQQCPAVPRPRRRVLDPPQAHGEAWGGVVSGMGPAQPRGSPRRVIRSGTMSGGIVEFVQSRLALLRDERRARESAAYLKTEQPMLGVSEPARRPVMREMVGAFPPADAAEYRANLCKLWEAGRQPGGFREMQYAALYYAEEFGDHHAPALFPLLRRLIVEGAWWDLVDWTASGIVCPIVLNHRARSVPVMRKWIDDEDLWVRRAAILCQLGHKGATDEDMLFEFCLRRAGEPEFFIRKAIGWALRQYARTNPDSVKQFLLAHKAELSPLSLREAGKHIGVAPAPAKRRRTADTPRSG